MTDFLLPQKELLSPKSFSMVNGERRFPVPPRLDWFSVVSGQMQHVRIDERIILK